MARAGSRRVVGLTLDALEDLPARCRSCAFWELDPVAGRRAVDAGTTRQDKEAWLSTTLLDWGSCGRVVYVDDVAAGWIGYAPPAYVPRAMAFPTAPVSPDAVLLTTAHVRPEYAGAGLGRLLVQQVVKDLLERGVRAVEAYGLAGRAVPGTDAGDAPPPACLVPADFLLAVGFKTVRPHPRHPRLRLDVKTTVSWREDVEVALERLLGSMNPLPAGVRRVEGR